MGADQSFVSAYEGEGVGASFSVPPGEIAQPAEPATTNTSTTTNSSNDINGQRPIYDPSAILASIESVRLLVQGFERRNAGRRTELEEMVERALLAEKRAEEFAAASTTTAAASTVAA